MTFLVLTALTVAVVIDDLGVKASVARPVQRVVSLVPSITEAIAMTSTCLGGLYRHVIRPDPSLEEITGARSG